MPPGTAGYLYAQARAFLAVLGTYPTRRPRLALGDFEYGEPHLVGVDGSAGEGTLHVTGRVPVVYRRPSGRELMERMGTALVTAMAGAFACELGKKAILVTRLDGAAKTHDLLALYRELPDDSRRRLEDDFLSARLISPNREEKIPFHSWRAYFRVQIADRLLMVLSALATDLEHPGQPLHRLPLPCAHLVRVHLVTGRNPLNRVLFAQRLKRHLPLEFRRKSAPFLSHFCVSFFLWSTP